MPAIGKVQVKEEGLKLNEIHQVCFMLILIYCLEI